MPSTGDSLGPRLRTFRMAAQRNVIWAAAPFVLLLAYVVWLGHEGQLLRWFNSMFSVGVVSALFALAIVLIAYTAAVGGAEAVQIHALGIVDVRREPRAVRWDEMRSLLTVCSPSGAVLRHVLRSEDGAAMTLASSIGDVEALVDEVRVRMLEHKAGALQARVMGGGSVRFGAIEARSEGILVGGKALPWSDLGDLEAEGGAIVVRDRSGHVVGQAPLGEVPNAFLLADLAERQSAAG